MNEQKFTGKADLYEKFRPTYPDELIDFLYDNARCEAVADMPDEHSGEFRGVSPWNEKLFKKKWNYARDI